MPKCLEVNTYEGLIFRGKLCENKYICKMFFLNTKFSKKSGMITGS